VRLTTDATRHYGSSGAHISVFLFFFQFQLLNFIVSCQTAIFSIVGERWYVKVYIYIYIHTS